MDSRIEHIVDSGILSQFTGASYPAKFYLLLLFLALGKECLKIPIKNNNSSHFISGRADYVTLVIFILGAAISNYPIKMRFELKYW